jgi:hypothetical protein
MPWVEVRDYSADGWASGINSADRSRDYCELLERGEILYFAKPPFDLPAEARSFLVGLPVAGSRLHKNISYRPEEDALRGFSAEKQYQPRVHAIMRDYSRGVTAFVKRLLAPYAESMAMDFASFRPLEEEGRDLPLHKRNDLLHVDAFPSRPTRGGRILRVFTNVNPSAGRVWRIADRFPVLAAAYARAAGLDQISGGSAGRSIMRLLHSAGLPVPGRSAYDEFMLHFHDWLKENTTFQSASQSETLDFPPLATWLVFTDGVPHAALSGQYAMEQTYIVPLDSLVCPDVAPIRVLETLCRKALA